MSSLEDDPSQSEEMSPWDDKILVKTYIDHMKSYTTKLEDPREEEELDEENEEAEELQDEDFEEDQGDYDEEEEVVAQPKTKKSAPTRNGASLVEFFEASLSASAARLDTPSRSKSTPSSASRLGKATKSSMQSPSGRRKSTTTPNRPQSTSKWRKSAHDTTYDDKYEEEDDEEAEQAYAAEPRKRAASNAAPPPAQSYWQHPMASYDPYYGSNWHHDPYSYWNAQPPQAPQQHYYSHPYCQYQQPQVNNSSSETKAYYYGLAMGLYQAANLIYEKRVLGAQGQAPSQPEGGYDYEEDEVYEEEMEEPEPTRKRRPKSKSTLSNSNAKSKAANRR